MIGKFYRLVRPLHAKFLKTPKMLSNRFLLVECLRRALESNFNLFKIKGKLIKDHWIFLA